MIENIGQLVLYKNNQLIALNKPATLPVQQDKTEDKALIDLAEIYCKSKVFLLHRLDRPAGGVVLFAKTKKSSAKLNEQFRARTIEKTYYAVVKNKPEKDKGTLVGFLKQDLKKNKSRVVKEEEKGAKKGVMEYEVVGKSDNYFLLKVELKTGRHHQIRAQLSHIGSPVKGDVKYGARRKNKDRSIHLHCWKMAFAHPVSKERQEVIAPFPKDPIWDAFEIK